MSDDSQMSAAAYRQEQRHYLTGFALALLLTIIPFGVVYSGALSGLMTGLVLALSAIGQLVVQLHYFLHIGLRKSSREDLQLVLFTTLIMIIMIAGTLWVLTNQMHRMM